MLGYIPHLVNSFLISRDLGKLEIAVLLFTFQCNYSLSV